MLQYLQALWFARIVEATMNGLTDANKSKSVGRRGCCIFRRCCTTKDLEQQGAHELGYELSKNFMLDLTSWG